MARVAAELKVVKRSEIVKMNSMVKSDEVLKSSVDLDGKAVDNVICDVPLNVTDVVNGSKDGNDLVKTDGVCKMAEDVTNGANVSA